MSEVERLAKCLAYLAFTVGRGGNHRRVLLIELWSKLAPQLKLEVLATSNVSAEEVMQETLGDFLGEH